MILKKAWIFCWLAIPFLWLLPTIDIQQHDTYYVIGSAPLALLFGPVLFVEGYIYWLFRNKNFKKWLTAFHLFSIFFLFAFWMSFTSLMNLLIPPPISPDRYYSFDTFQAHSTSFWTGERIFFGFLALNFILFLLGQLAFIVNFVLSRKER
jgi:heme/copper-type cytochrome/quinol oxidase subunit 1